MSASPRKVKSKSIGHYVLLKTIGEGTFGKVKLGTHILTGERVAIKVLEKERFVDVADVERVAREIHILKLIRHPHIIQLYEIIETPKQLYLIMEFASGGELFDYIVQHGRAEEREACRFLHQILAGIEKVHGMCVVHRDLKPENLLLDDHKDIKIVDFGLSNTYQEGQLLQTACGSPCYAAPEMIAGHRYVPSMVDIWSCGVILFALVCGYLPFESTESDQNHAELYKKILEADYEMPNFVSPEVANLIGGMLTTDPEKRLNIDGIRQNVWYRQITEASTPDYEDQGILDEEILEQLESFGFPRDYAMKCLKTNKHNHVTTTYFLIKEKRHAARAIEGRGNTMDRFIAEMDATGVEEVPIGAATAAAVAAVATPSRGQRAEGPEQPERRKRPGSAPGSSRGGSSAMPTNAAAWGGHADGSQTARGARSGDVVWGSAEGHLAAENGHCNGAITPRGAGTVGPAGSAPSQVAPQHAVAVPKLNLDDRIREEATSGEEPSAAVHSRRFYPVDQHPDEGRCGSVPSSSSGVQAHHSRRHPAAAGAPESVPSDVDGASIRSQHRQADSCGNGAARSASPAPRVVGASPAANSGGTTPRGRPVSARSQGSTGAPVRRRSGDRGSGQHHSRRASSPYAGAGYYMRTRDGFDDYGVAPAYGTLGGYVGGGMNGYGGMPGYAREPDASPMWSEAPLTARPRLQGNVAPGYRERPLSARPSGAPPAAWGAGPVRALAPMSARGPRNGSGGAEAPRDGDACHMSCQSSLPPRRIVQEALRALAARGIPFRHISGFLIRCQATGVRFEAEVLQLSRGGGFMLRFSRHSGDAWQYKDICAQLLAEMNL